VQQRARCEPSPLAIDRARDPREQVGTRSRQRDDGEHRDHREDGREKSDRGWLERGESCEQPRALKHRPRQPEHAEPHHANPRREPRHAAALLAKPVEQAPRRPRGVKAAHDAAREQQHRQHEHADQPDRRDQSLGLERVRALDQAGDQRACTRPDHARCDPQQDAETAKIDQHRGSILER
jgi:hypothetical protein